MSAQQPPYGEELAIRLAAARVWAVHRAPYLANAVFSLVMEPMAPNTALLTGIPIADPEFAAFPTDTRWVMHVDPGTALSTPVEDIGWWILHQIGHLVRNHAQRSPVRPTGGPDSPLIAVGYAGGRDEEAKRWNQAADAEINDDLEAEGMPGPSGVISPHELGLPSNRLAEEYLPMIAELEQMLAGSGRELSAGLDCGSSTDGIDRSWDDTGSGGLDALDQELLERSVAMAIQERSTARGEVPGGWQRWATEKLWPKGDWRVRIASLIRRSANRAAGQVDFSYGRPSRRSASNPMVITPQMVRPVPETVIVLDTSGSIRVPELNRLTAEIDGVLSNIGLRKPRVICCDLKAHPAQRIRRIEDLQIVGGGGTDMRTGLAAAGRLHPRPDLVVVLTDGVTPWPERRPPFESVVCLVGDEGEAPAWACSVHIPEIGVSS